MVIYQSKTSKTKQNLHLVECTVQAMFGCRIGEIILLASQGGEIYD